MIIVIPNAIDGLDAVIEGLANYTVKDIKKELYFDKISFYLPKFEIESTLLLDKQFKQVISIHRLPQC